MRSAQIFLNIAKDETETLVKYNEMLENADDLMDDERAVIEEIISDEFNHAIVSLLFASKITGIKIATDDLKEDPNDMKVEETEDDKD